MNRPLGSYQSHLLLKTRCLPSKASPYDDGRPSLLSALFGEKPPAPMSRSRGQERTSSPPPQAAVRTEKRTENTLQHVVPSQASTQPPSPTPEEVRVDREKVSSPPNADASSQPSAANEQHLTGSQLHRSLYDLSPEDSVQIESDGDASDPAAMDSTPVDTPAPSSRSAPPVPPLPIAKMATKVDQSPIQSATNSHSIAIGTDDHTTKPEGGAPYYDALTQKIKEQVHRAERSEQQLHQLYDSSGLPPTSKGELARDLTNLQQALSLLSVMLESVGLPDVWDADAPSLKESQPSGRRDSMHRGHSRRDLRASGDTPREHNDRDRRHRTAKESFRHSPRHKEIRVTVCRQYEDEPQPYRKPPRQPSKPAGRDVSPPPVNQSYRSIQDSANYTNYSSDWTRSSFNQPSQPPASSLERRYSGGRASGRRHSRSPSQSSSILEDIPYVNESTEWR